jgi:cation diffusion facilitator family transporter
MEISNADHNHYHRVRKVLLSILALNWAVAVAKIGFGVFSRCSSITADGFHSLSDGTSNIIGLIGIALACQPKDKEHPYGHKKYETFFSLGIATLLFVISFELFETAVRRLALRVEPLIDIRSFIVMLATLAVNCVVMIYEKKKSIEYHSDILLSDSLHTRADIFISLSVICGLIGIKLGYPILDPLITFLIAFVIAYSGFIIAKQSSYVLCDKIVIVNEKAISDIVLLVKGVKACHKIRTRGRLDDIHIDLHVQVNPHMHIDEAHKICSTIEEALKKGIAGVTDVIVHVEPKEK